MVIEKRREIFEPPRPGMFIVSPDYRGPTFGPFDAHSKASRGCARISRSQSTGCTRSDRRGSIRTCCKVSSETTKSWLAFFARAVPPTERSARPLARQQPVYVYVVDLRHRVARGGFEIHPVKERCLTGELKPIDSPQRRAAGHGHILPAERLFDVVPCPPVRPARGRVDLIAEPVEQLRAAILSRNISRWRAAPTERPQWRSGVILPTRRIAVGWIEAG
jgi:hypothetical protein